MGSAYESVDKPQLSFAGYVAVGSTQPGMTELARATQDGRVFERRAHDRLAESALWLSMNGASLHGTDVHVTEDWTREHDS